MVADEFWNYLSCNGTYHYLLNCFEKAGIELRPEIDEYFARYTIKKNF
jgi:type II restriction enzyme